MTPAAERVSTHQNASTTVEAEIGTTYSHEPLHEAPTSVPAAPETHITNNFSPESLQSTVSSYPPQRGCEICFGGGCCTLGQMKIEPGNFDDTVSLIPNESLKTEIQARSESIRGGTFKREIIETPEGKYRVFSAKDIVNNEMIDIIRITPIDEKAKMTVQIQQVTEMIPPPAVLEEPVEQIIESVQVVQKDVIPIQTPDDVAVKISTTPVTQKNEPITYVDIPKDTQSTTTSPHDVQSEAFVAVPREEPIQTTQRESKSTHATNHTPSEASPPFVTLGMKPEGSEVPQQRTTIHKPDSRVETDAIDTTGVPDTRIDTHSEPVDPFRMSATIPPVDVNVTYSIPTLDSPVTNNSLPDSAFVSLSTPDRIPIPIGQDQTENPVSTFDSTETLGTESDIQTRFAVTQLQLNSEDVLQFESEKPINPTVQQPDEDITRPEGVSNKVAYTTELPSPFEIPIIFTQTTDLNSHDAFKTSMEQKDQPERSLFFEMTPEGFMYDLSQIKTIDVKPLALLRLALDHTRTIQTQTEKSHKDNPDTVTTYRFLLNHDQVAEFQKVLVFIKNQSGVIPIDLSSLQLIESRNGIEIVFTVSSLDTLILFLKMYEDMLLTYKTEQKTLTHMELLETEQAPEEIGEDSPIHVPVNDQAVVNALSVLFFGCLQCVLFQHAQQTMVYAHHTCSGQCSNCKKEEKQAFVVRPSPRVS